MADKYVGLLVCLGSINTSKSNGKRVFAIKIFFRRSYDRPPKRRTRRRNNRGIALIVGLLVLAVVAFKLNQDGGGLFANGLAVTDSPAKSDEKVATSISALPVTPVSTSQDTPSPITTPTVQPLSFAANDPRVLDLLKGFTLPIKGAKLPTYDGQLPNALRAYRAGTHEGLDFYNGFVAVPVKIGTEVVAVKNGTVIRADADYRESSEQQVKEWLDTASKLGYTPKEILDHLRGRQVWIDHGNNVITRYAHLSGIATGIRPGVTVSTGQLIAYVGNSGSPEAAEGTNDDVHLHFEVWIGDHYLGQGLTPPQVKEWLRKVFPQ